MSNKASMWTGLAVAVTVALASGWVNVALGGGVGGGDVGGGMIQQAEGGARSSRSTADMIGHVEQAVFEVQVMGPRNELAMSGMGFMLTADGQALVPVAALTGADIRNKSTQALQDATDADDTRAAGATPSGEPGASEASKSTSQTGGERSARKSRTSPTIGRAVDQQQASLKQAYAAMTPGAPPLPMTVVGVDRGRGMALVHVKKPEGGGQFAHVKWADQPPRPDAPVWSIGMSRPAGYTFSESTVIGSGSARTWPAALVRQSSVPPKSRWLVLRGRPPGCRGGPVVNSAGEVVAVTTSLTDPSKNRVVALASSEVRAIIKRIRDSQAQGRSHKFIAHNTARPSSHPQNPLSRGKPSLSSPPDSPPDDKVESGRTSAFQRPGHIKLGPTPSLEVPQQGQPVELRREAIKLKSFHTCRMCHGSGTILDSTHVTVKGPPGSFQTKDKYVHERVTCPTCHGSGLADGEQIYRFSDRLLKALAQVNAKASRYAHAIAYTRSVIDQLAAKAPGTLNKELAPIARRRTSPETAPGTPVLVVGTVADKTKAGFSDRPGLLVDIGHRRVLMLHIRIDCPATAGAQVLVGGLNAGTIPHSRPRTVVLDHGFARPAPASASSVSGISGNTASASH